MRILITIILLLSTLVGVVPGQDLAVDEQPHDMNDGTATITEVVSRLQDLHRNTGRTFVEQSELDCLIREGGGGSCASAAGVIVLQSLRAMLDLPILQNPHRAVLGSFSDQKALLNGRVTNHQFVKLIEYYQTHLTGAAVSVSVQSAPNSPHATGTHTWNNAGRPQLDLHSDELKVISYTVTKDDGDVLGRHFVILKNVNGDQIHVVDPQKPVSKRRYELAMGECERVFLRDPPGIRPRTSVYELNTIFTITLDRSGKTNDSEHAMPTTVEQVKSQIDQTAARLRERGALRSPTAWRSETASTGLPRLDLPAEFGGAEWPAVKMLEVFRHAGRHDLNLRDVVGAAHGRLLLQSTEPDVRDIIQQVAEGEAYIAVAITEPNFGSDLTSMKSHAQRVDGGFLLNGHKRFNARLDQASHVVVFVRSSSGTPRRLSAFLVPTNAEGLNVERFRAHGLTGNSYGGMTMENVFVRDGHRIGEADAGRDIFDEHFRFWRLMQTAAAIGTAEEALEQMAERLKSRHVYGAPIGRFTHLQQPLAQYTIQLRMAYSLATEAAQLLDQKEFAKADDLIYGLKAEGVEIALAAVDAAARSFGGEGYSNLVDIGDRLRDLNGLRIADGTTDVMRSVVVARIYGNEFWKMAIKRRKYANTKSTE